VQKRGTTGAGGSLKPTSARGEMEREKGGTGSGRRHAEQGGSAWTRGGSASWTGTTRTWRLQAAPIAACGARLTSAVGASCEQGR
jgi:hypothetical protein